MDLKTIVPGIHPKSILFLLILVLSIFLTNCSDDDPIVDDGGSVEKEKEKEEPEAPTTFSAKRSYGSTGLPGGGGVITSEFSDFIAGNDASRIADRNKNTMVELPYSSFYIIWAGSNDSFINQYMLTSAGDSRDGDPKKWTLHGSNDKKEWKVLDEQSNQQFAFEGEMKIYPILNEERFKYYKLEIKENSGGKVTRIAEWAMNIYSVETDMGELRPQFAFHEDGKGVEKVMDGDPETTFSTPFDSFYVQWNVKEPTFYNHYFITSAPDHSTSDPKSWILYGSVNNQYWVKLDEQTNQQFTGRGETKAFPFDNENIFKFFRLEVNENHGDKSTCIAEWGLKVIYTGIEDLMKHASGFSYSSQTPMGSHYANRHVTTDDDRTWLMDPTNEPPAPGHVSHLYLREFPVSLYPFGKPSPADVNQHAIGNCGALAAMASMAYIYPNFVKALITDNGDNTYTVDMFDPQRKPVQVTVTNKFLTGNGKNIDAVSGKNNTATWATVLEKAIMKYNVIYKVNPDIGGIGSEHVVPLFTGNGNSFAFSPGKLTGRELARVVSVCLDQGKFIIGGFNQGGLPVDNSETVTGHAYTIMHPTDKNALFSMRNPWGGNPKVDGVLDGVLNIPDDGVIPPTIDFRIVDPGIAINYGDEKPVSYTPPTMSKSGMKMRVASYLLNNEIK